MMESISLVDPSDESNADPDWDLIEHYPGPRTPSTVSDHQPEADPQPQPYDTSDPGSDEEYGGPAGAPKRKKGGYDSRIEQILYENPDLPILIVDAGKSLESGGKYIVYTIRTGVSVISTI
jgi:sorting nexin-41/42